MRSGGEQLFKNAPWGEKNLNFQNPTMQICVLISINRGNSF